MSRATIEAWYRVPEQVEFQSTPDSHEPGDEEVARPDAIIIKFQSTPDSHEPGDASSCGYGSAT